MTTNSVNASQTPGAFGLNNVGGGAKKSMGQEDFLRLMVAQVQNQDPLEPQQNGEFLAQLAQFSTSDGINKMQRSLEQLSSSLQSNQALQASALVGRKVMMDSEHLKLDSEGGSKVAIGVVPGLVNLQAYIYSESGELIKNIPLGQPPIGQHEFIWDGTDKENQRVAEGNYRVEVHGVYDGQERRLKTMTASNVDSVSLGHNGEGLRLNVAGVGAVALSDIGQITL